MPKSRSAPYSIGYDLLVAVLGAVVAATCFTGYVKASIPLKDSLVRLHGRAHTIRSPRSGKDLLFRVEGCDADLEYLDWLPRAAAVAEAVKNEEELIVDAAPAVPVWRAWSVSTTGEDLASYEEIARASRENSYVALLLSMFFALASAYHAGRLVLKRNAKKTKRQRSG